MGTNDNSGNGAAGSSPGPDAAMTPPGDQIYAVRLANEINSEKISDLRSNLAKVDTTVRNIEKALTAIGAVLTLVAGLGLWNLIINNSIEADKQEIAGLLASADIERKEVESINLTIRAERDELVNLIVDDYAQDIGEMIDQLSFSGQSSQAKVRLEQVKNKRSRLDILTSSSSKYKILTDMVAAIDAFEKKDKTQALDIMNGLAIDVRGHDQFLVSRVTTLRAFFEILKNTQRYDATLERELEQAIAMDGSNGLAFNLLAIQQTNRYGELFSTDREEAVRSIQAAFINFDIYGRLAPSSTVLYKVLNNTLWTKAELINRFLTQVIEDDLEPQQRNDSISYLEVALGESLDSYFGSYEEILQKIQFLVKPTPNLVSTEAEILSVYSFYQRYFLLNESGAELTAREGRRIYEQAVDLDLHASDEFPIETFLANPLIMELRKDATWTETIKSKLEA